MAEGDELHGDSTQESGRVLAYSRSLRCRKTWSKSGSSPVEVRVLHDPEIM